MKLRNTFRVAAIAAVAIGTTMTAACGGTRSSGSADTVTVYSADGLATWYEPQFDRFTKDTGISVNLVEAGSGEVVSRVEKEQSNPQASERFSGSAARIIRRIRRTSAKSLRS